MSISQKKTFKGLSLEPDSVFLNISTMIQAGIIFSVIDQADSTDGGDYILSIARSYAEAAHAVFREENKQNTTTTESSTSLRDEAAAQQQPASTGSLAIDEPLPNWGATIKVAQQQISPTSFAAIIERIRSRRVALGLSTEELSTQLGFEIDTVEDWENGCDVPELTILLPLSRALFCEPEWLLTGSLEGMTRINEAPLTPVKVMQGVDMTGVGERIRNARVSRRMTHKELEETAGLPDGVISVWESRKAYPPDEAFDKLAKALNTSVTWLLTGREIARES
ncbi:helix-turn-helix domain-containing protein [Enterobacter asburiae]|uniref:helix-turn-helix domain-containing protein n=1 Tax=Enterobacter asburiae TaxID=61645 RepID=UPI002FF5D743